MDASDVAFTFFYSNPFPIIAHACKWASYRNSRHEHFYLVQDVVNCLISYYTLILQSQLFSNLAAYYWVLLSEPGRGNFCWRLVLWLHCWKKTFHCLSYWQNFIEEKAEDKLSAEFSIQAHIHIFTCLCLRNCRLSMIYVWAFIIWIAWKKISPH